MTEVDGATGKVAERANAVHGRETFGEGGAQQRVGVRARSRFGEAGRLQQGWGRLAVQHRHMRDTCADADRELDVSVRDVDDDLLTTVEGLGRVACRLIASEHLNVGLGRDVQPERQLSGFPDLADVAGSNRVAPEVLDGERTLSRLRWRARLAAHEAQKYKCAEPAHTGRVARATHACARPRSTSLSGRG